MTSGFRQIALCAVFAGYLLGIWRGNVALWKDEDPRPVYVSPIPADSLPAADQLKLRRGIPAGTREELFALLEDYF